MPSHSWPVVSVPVTASFSILVGISLGPPIALGRVARPRALLRVAERCVRVVRHLLLAPAARPVGPRDDAEEAQHQPYHPDAAQELAELFHGGLLLPEVFGADVGEVDHP